MYLLLNQYCVGGAMVNLAEERRPWRTWGANPPWGTDRGVWGHSEYQSVALSVKTTTNLPVKVQNW